MKDTANIAIAIRKEVMYLLSNGSFANVEHCNLDLNFEGHEFLKGIISIYQRISQTAIGSLKIPTDLQSCLW